jgi:hypothetical protein
MLATPVLTDRIKIVPVTCVGWCSMRVGLLVQEDADPFSIIYPSASDQTNGEGTVRVNTND